jgi:photosystem II stability/assembly factor-like uncharacterized protein
MSYPQGDTLLDNSSISFATKNTGWIFTSGHTDINVPPNQYSSKILKTTDGGKSWALQKYVNDSFDPHSIYTTDSLHCWAINTQGNLIFTVDGGSKWDTSSINSEQSGFPIAMYFFNNSEGMALNNKHPWFTNDGGKSWIKGDSSLLSLTASDIVFVNKRLGWVVSPVTRFATDAGYIATTNNSGTTWNFQDSITAKMFAVDFIDSLRIFAVGTNWNNGTGFIYSTADGGKTWTYQQFIGSGAFWDIGFLDDKNGWATGLGKILKTTDGGTTWETQINGFQSYLRKLVILKEEKAAYVFGDNNYQLPYMLLYADLSNLTSINYSEENFPKTFRLAQNYPNPFNPATIISYELPTDIFVTLKIFDMLGREVTTLVSEKQSKGNHFATWDAAGFTSGLYFYRLQSDRVFETKKLLLLK